MTPEQRDARKQRADDATCAALVMLLHRLKAHQHGDSPINVGGGS